MTTEDYPHIFSFRTPVWAIITSMAISYPRKQTVIIFVVCSIAVIGTAYYTSSQNIVSASEQESALIMAKMGKPVAAAPIDTSSLPDWRKSFTDTAKKPDSTIKTTVPEKLTQTDELGRAFFARYAELKQANMIDNTDVVNQSAADLVTANLQTMPPKVYSVSDIHLTQTSNASALNTFSSAVGHAIESYSATKSESDILQTYLASNDPAVLKDLDSIVKAYKKIISSLLAIPTPPSISDQELAVVNAVSTLEFAAENLRSADTDTIRGLAGVTAHANGVNQMIDALTQLHDALTAEGVSFDFNQDVLNIFLK